MSSLISLLLYTLLELGPLAHAQAGSASQVTEAAQAEADRVLAMPSQNPAGRMNQILAARDLDPPARFALATRAPGLVEQLEIAPYKLVLAYFAAVPAPELHRIRRGETVIRTSKDLKKGSSEARALGELAEALDLPPNKVVAVRVGPLENRVIRVELSTKKDSEVVEMAWPSTPQRDEKSRDALAKVYGARPSSRAIGAGAPLPLEDGSFEKPESLGSVWVTEKGPDLGGGTPVAEVSVDQRVAIDGLGSVRFYATQRTRQFLIVAQRVTVAPSTPLVARAMLKTENVRPEFLQKPTDLYLEMSFEDIAGSPVGAPLRAVGAGETHTWQALKVEGVVPDAAAYVRIAVMSGQSGTAWFDGVTLQIAD